MDKIDLPIPENAVEAWLVEKLSIAIEALEEYEKIENDVFGINTPCNFAREALEKIKNG